MKMIRNIKKVLLIGLFSGVSLCATDLETFNKNITEAKHPDLKQMLRCEREAAFIKKNPQECLKAADLFLASRKKVTSTTHYRVGFYNSEWSIIDLKIYLPETANKTDKEFIDEFVASSYWNAGVIYSNLGEHEKEVKMYKKCLEFDSKHSYAYNTLGFIYATGQGVKMDKYKAYEYYTTAAKLGNEHAQNNLDILCKESPWACK